VSAHKRLPSGVGAALLAALLFGLSTPLAKLLLGTLPPLLLAGLLYLGSGVGLSALRLARRARGARPAGLAGPDLPWLAGAVFFGGMLGPTLLMIGLQRTPASASALLLNLEGVFTALLAWFVFKENFDRRIAFGMGLIVAGGVVLARQGTAGLTLPGGALAVAGACLCWAIDNNLTQKVSTADPLQIASLKGLVAGVVNTALGLTSSPVPAASVASGAMLLGLVGYGLSLALFVIALRHLGTARTGAYFSLAPFMGAILAITLLREPLTPLLLVAGALMGAGTWLHLSERHEHEHEHEPLDHTHSHVHDEHHRHEHQPGTDVREPHAHRHVHERLVHRHPHYPDIHHRHGH
jgi:drug/metabolite transporter (DMT)-like permease